MIRLSCFVVVAILYSLLDGTLISAGVTGWPYWSINLICIAISVVSMVDALAWRKG